MNTEFFSNYFFKFMLALLHLFLLNAILQSNKSVSCEIVAQSIISNDSCNTSTGSCFCDELCVMKKDCCHDHKTFVQYTQSVHSSKIPHYNCIHSARTFADDADLKKQGDWFQAVTHCPPGTQKGIANRCIKAKDLTINFDDVTAEQDLNVSKNQSKFISIDLAYLRFRIRTEDIRLMAPVVSNVNGRVYANIYCAHCHGELDSAVQGQALVESVLQERLRSYNVFVRCRTYHDTDRLCVADTQLSQGWRRPCEGKKYIQPQSTQNVFSLSDFKWHQFLVIPQKYLDFASLDDYLVNGSKTVSIIESIFDILQLLVCILSALCLCVLIIVYANTKELRCRVSSQLVMGMAVFMLGLLSVYLTLPLLISQKGNSDHGNCLIVAVLLHYFFLGSFSWMSTLGLSLLNTFGGIHICRLCFTYFKLKLTQCGTGPNSVSQMISDSSVNGMMVRTNVRNHSKDIHKRTALSSVFAITLPLCFVVPALILNEIYRYNQCWTGDENDRPSYFTSPGNDKEQQNCTEMSRQMRYYNPGFCFIESGIRPWFTVHGAFILWFFLPTALMLAFNSGVLLLVSTYIWLSNQNKTLKSLSEDTVTSGDSKSAKNYDKYNRNMIRICMHLSITLGIVWIFQLLASLIPHQSIVNRIAGLISSGQGAALGFVSLMNTKRGKSLLNWTSFFHSTRSNVRSSDVKSVSSPCQSGVKAANETDIPVADVRSVNY